MKDYDKQGKERGKGGRVRRLEEKNRVKEREEGDEEGKIRSV